MTDNNSGNGIGFFGLLTIAFIVLKLTGFITWSWFWVLAPITIPTIFILFVLGGIFLLGIFGKISDWFFKK